MGNAVLEIAGPRRAGATASGRVLLVSNRLPVTGGTEHGEARPSSGGLVSGLRQVMRHWPAIWLGWDGVARPEAGAEVVQPFEGGTTVALSMSESEVAGFYRRFCNGLLWPVLHGRIADVPGNDEDWQIYRAVNQRFADAVLGQARPGDRIWIHDFHLFLLPGLLRQRAPELPITFFLHTSFPDAEVFRTIPQGESLLEGVLAADSIGFHTTAYEANFLRTAAASGRRIQGSSVVGARATRTHVHPMGIDVDTFATLARDSDVLDDVADIRRGHGRLLLGVDRLDYTKGIPQRLLAFEMLLEKYPRLRGEVSFFQVAVPSREEVAAYRDLKEVVEALVRRINGRFGRTGWMPVDYLYGSVDLGSLVALYRASDVMIVTPVRDGLNLVAKEFVATRTDGDGVLVLSRYAGSAEELDAALQVDPNRIGPLAETFRQALTMPKRERRRRMRALRRSVAANTVFDWAGDFIRSLGTEPPTPRNVGQQPALMGVPAGARTPVPVRTSRPLPAWAAMSPATS